MFHFFTFLYFLFIRWFVILVLSGLCPNHEEIGGFQEWPQVDPVDCIANMQPDLVQCIVNCVHEIPN